MNPVILQSQFVQIALPIMFTILVASWWQNKRVEDLRDAINKRLDDIVARLGRIEAKLENHADRLARLEERTGLVKVK
jgi:hypothetical protein